jgi:hypothetical protein
MIFWRIIVFIFLVGLLKYTITDSTVDDAIELAHYREIAQEEQVAYQNVLDQLNIELN